MSNPDLTPDDIEGVRKSVHAFLAPSILSVRSYEWQGHRLTVQRAVSNNPDAAQHEPSCETCSIPYAIAEAVKFMNRFSLHTLALNNEDAIHWLV